MNKSNLKPLNLAVVAVLTLSAPLAGAMDIGLGVSLNNEGGGNGGYGVSMPLRFANISVEPELSFYSASQDTTYPSTPTNNRENDFHEYILETGVYWRRPVVPSVEMYLGGRVGYVKYAYTYTYPLSPASNYKYEESGYFLGPTLGAEYFFSKNFSLGLDVSLLYESTSGKEVDAGVVSISQDRTGINYQSRARLRFYF
jgi:hypothetical protein